MNNRTVDIHPEFKDGIIRSRELYKAIVDDKPLLKRALVKGEGIRIK